MKTMMMMMMMTLALRQDGLGKNRPEGLSLAGISLRCPGGQAGQASSIEGTSRPPSEQGTCPLPGLATGNVGYQTASSGSDEAATGLLDNTPEKHSGDHTVEYMHPIHECSSETIPRPKNRGSRPRRRLGHRRLLPEVLH